MTDARMFKVYTFFHPVPGRPPVRSRVSAYTKWASEHWDGCVLYEIHAVSADEAKRAAIDQRLAKELAAAAGAR